MKKQILQMLCGLTLIAGLCVPLPTTYAAGGLPEPEVSVAPSSAIANGSSQITITVFSAYFKCEEGGTTYFSRSAAPCSDPLVTPAQGKPAAITVSGSGNTLSGGSDGGNGIRYASTGEDGKAIFTVSSTAAEGKTITARYYEQGSLFGPSVTATITFTAIPPAAKPSAPKVVAQPTVAPEPTPPETLKPSTIEVGGQAVAATENIAVKHDESFKLSGKTVANGVVKLFIFSTPREATVTADGNGDWSYEVEGLEPGSHHIEAEVTDPKTNKTSTRATLASFTIAEPPKIIAKTNDHPSTIKKSNGGWVWIIASAGCVLALAGAGFWLWWRKKHKPAVATGTPTDNQPPQQEL